MDRGGPALLLLDRSEADEAPVAACLTERVAFHLLGSDAAETETRRTA